MAIDERTRTAPRATYKGPRDWAAICRYVAERDHEVLAMLAAYDREPTPAPQPPRPAPPPRHAG